jgi:hypothetical protein
MSAHHFTEWLTVEETADLLSELADRNYSSDDIMRAIQNDYLLAHVYPADDGYMGIFEVEAIKGEQVFSPECRSAFDVQSAKLVSTFYGPFPVHFYPAYSMGLASKTNGMLGLTAFTRLETTTNCYLLGEDGRPVSLADKPPVILIHERTINEFLNALPFPPKKERPYIEICKVNMVPFGGRQFVANTAIVGLGMTDHGWQLSERRPKKEPIESLSLNKFIAIAAHLISEQGDDLDKLQPIPSKALGLSIKGKPKKRAIAKAMERTAKRLNHEGWGSGHRGFEEVLRKALRQHG